MTISAMVWNVFEYDNFWNKQISPKKTNTLAQ